MGILYNWGMNLIVIILIAVGAFVLLVLAGLAIVNFSGEEMVSKFNDVSKIGTNISAYDLAQRVSQDYFSNRISIVFKDAFLSDSYSSSNVLTLCSKYARQENLAGLAVCAHELGHAFQFKEQRQKMKKYGKRVNFSKLLSKLVTPIFVVAIVLCCFDKLIFAGITAGIALIIFIIALSVKMSTIKIEKEASDKALEILQEYAYLTDHEINSAKKFLDSAKQTYVADLLKSILKWTGLTRK